MGSVNCNTKVLSLSWDASPVSGANYTLYYRQLWGDNSTAHYPTLAATSHSLSDLQCGQSYAFSVYASDSTCNSSMSPNVELDTGRLMGGGLASLASNQHT